jgi:hypothetical protein
VLRQCVKDQTQSEPELPIDRVVGGAYMLRQLGKMRVLGARCLHEDWAY